MTKEDLDALLECLSADREDAAEQYKQIHRKLVTFFRGRGVQHAEEGADETLNRVAKKVREGVDILNIRAYVLGVARRHSSEILKKPQDVPLDQIAEPHLKPDYDEVQEKRLREECLERALVDLDPEQRDLIVEWYRYMGGEKIKSRTRLAAQRQCTPEALRVHAYHIRQKLRQFVEECMMGSSRTVQ